MTYYRLPPPQLDHPTIVRLSLTALALVVAFATLPEVTELSVTAMSRRVVSGRRAPIVDSVYASTTLVVNEVDYDQVGTDTVEFVEIKNVSSSSIDLGEYDVLGINGGSSPSTEYRRSNLSSVNLGAGEYYVLGSANVHGVDQVVGTSNIWQNGAPDAIAIVQNTTGDPDDDVLIDSVSYEGDTAGGPTGGGSWTETNGTTPGDNNSDYYLGISRYTDGSDTDDNSSDFSLRCITPGETNSSATSGCSAPGPTPTATSGSTATPTATATGTPLSTATPQSPTSTPQASATPDAPTSTPVPPTPTDSPATATTVPPTATSEPTQTETVAPPTPTDLPSATPVASATESVTETPVSTPTTIPPSATPESPTSTPAGPTATQVQSTATATPVTMAVSLSHFRARRSTTRVLVEWETITEYDHAGFRLLRQAGSQEPQVVGPRLFEPRAIGGELGGARYRFIDRAAPTCELRYWLEDVDTRGRVTRHGPARVPPGGPYTPFLPPPLPGPQPAPGFATSLPL